MKSELPGSRSPVGVSAPASSHTPVPSLYVTCASILFEQKCVDMSNKRQILRSAVAMVLQFILMFCTDRSESCADLRVECAHIDGDALLEASNHQGSGRLCKKCVSPHGCCKHKNVCFRTDTQRGSSKGSPLLGWASSESHNIVKMRVSKSLACSGFCGSHSEGQQA